MARSCARDAVAGARDGVLIVSTALGLGGVAASVVASPWPRNLLGAALALLMLAIAVSDARHFIVPDRLSLAAFVLGLVNAALFDAPPLAAIAGCLLRAAATALPFLVLMVAYARLRGREGLGLGDVKLAAVAGCWLDWLTIVWTIEAAALAALAVYTVRRYLLRHPLDAATELPFGAFLAPAIWLGWLAEAVWLLH
jgi:leader peptidase (prepilin peptidase)/N-methyltransferase